jgi:hypothetical protein
MERVSPYILCKRLEGQLQAKLSSIDLPSLPHAEQTVILGLRQSLIDARLTIQEYELSETRDEQLRVAQEAKGFLEQVNKSILAVSGQGIFSAVDVAHLSANIEQIADNIR